MCRSTPLLRSVSHNLFRVGIVPNNFPAGRLETKIVIITVFCIPKGHLDYFYSKRLQDSEPGYQTPGFWRNLYPNGHGACSWDIEIAPFTPLATGPSEDRIPRQPLPFASCPFAQPVADTQKTARSPSCCLVFRSLSKQVFNPTRIPSSRYSQDTFHPNCTLSEILRETPRDFEHCHPTTGSNRNPPCPH